MCWGPIWAWWGSVWACWGAISRSWGVRRPNSLVFRPNSIVFRWTRAAFARLALLVAFEGRLDRAFSTDLVRSKGFSVDRGTARAPFSVDFHSISGSRERSDEKRPTCNPYAPWRADCVSRPPRQTLKSSEITPGASRERLSKKIHLIRPLEHARAPFLTNLARFGLLLASSWVSFASFGRVPGVSRGAPGAPRLASDRPKGTPDTPGPIWDRSGLRFCSIFAFWLVLAVRFGSVCSFAVRVCCVCL